MNRADATTTQARKVEGRKEVIRRVWLPALAVVAVAVGVFSVLHLRSVFGSDPVVKTPMSDTAKKFTLKVVTFEIYGSGGTAVVNYQDLNGKPQRAGTVGLPWTMTLTTTDASVSPNIMAQTEGQSISCRITVDHEVKAEKTSSGADAQTFCYLKAA